MLCSSMNHSRYTPLSRIYESLRISFSEAQSASQTGEGNSQYGTMWIMNSESGESKKITKGTLIPDGWVKGRNIKNANIMWIMNSGSGESKRIKKGSPIPDGWIKGRKSDRMWIMNSESGESKTIKKDDIIPDGWIKGRKIKK